MSQQRPTPLVAHPQLVRLLEPTPLSDRVAVHADYLATHFTGRTLVVVQDADELAAIEAFVEDLPEVTAVTAVHNDARRHGDLEAVDLPPADAQFDAVFYMKTTAAWFARSPDFHQLTDRLAHGGTLLAKTKWMPGSDRLSLEEISVVGSFGFDHPQVYSRWTKTISAPTLSAACEGRPASPASTPNAAHVGRPLATATNAFRSQFEGTTDAREFRPSWQWHSALQSHVEERLEDVDGPVANLCCGTSELGDVRVDLLASFEADGEQHATGATVQGDAATVPLTDDSVAAVVTDPPWKVPVRERIDLFSEAHRIVEPGGSIIVNAWWIPTHPYAQVTDIRPTTANVKDHSLAGPGGLSFLTTFEVLEQPDLGAATYTLVDHAERCGVEAIGAGPQGPDWPFAVPEADPRFTGGSSECAHCDSTALAPVTVEDKTLFECIHCGFRNGAEQLLAGDGPAR